MGREREEWDGIRRDWEGAKPLIYKGFGGFGYPFNALRRRLFYPLNYGESHIRAFAQKKANRTAVWTARRV